MRLPTALVLTLVLAGCAGTPGPGAPTTPSPPPRAATLVAAIDEAIAESSLALLPDGNVSLVAVSGPVHAWRGPASGGAFVDAEAPDGPGDTDLAASGGIVHHVGLAGSSGLVPVQRSLDGGASWSKPVDVAEGEAAVDRPWIAAAGERVVAAWGARPFTLGLSARVSDDAGETWGAPVVYARGASEIGDVAVDPASGRIYAAWTAEPGILRVSASDDGRAWREATVARMASYSFPSIAVDAAGNVYVAWSAALDGANVPRAQGEVGGVRLPFAATRAYFSASTDGGTTWSAPLDLTPEGSSSWYPALAAGPAGRIAVAWYEVELGTNDGRGRLAVAIADEGAGATPRFTRVDPATEPFPVGISCASERVCDGDRTRGEVLEIAMTPAGDPAVTWVQGGEDGGVEVHYALLRAPAPAMP